MQFFQVLSPFRYKLSDNEKNNLRVMSIDYNPGDKFVTYSWNNGSQGHMGVQLPFCNQLIQRNKKGGRSQRWRWMKRSDDDQAFLLSTSLSFIRSKPRKISSSYWDRNPKKGHEESEHFQVRLLPWSNHGAYRLGHHSPGISSCPCHLRKSLLELAVLCGFTRVVQ